MGNRRIFETDLIKNSIVIMTIMFVVLVPFVAHSSDVLQIGARENSFNLNPYLDVLIDPTGNLTIQDVSFGPKAKNFQSSKTTGLNLGFTSAVMWLRFTVANDSYQIENRLLVLENPPIRRADLYVPTENGQFDIIRGGTVVPFSEKQVAERNHIYPLQIAANSSITFFMRLQAETTLVADLKICSVKAHQVHERWDTNALILVLGVFLSLIFYNISTFATTREFLYFYLSMLTVCLGLFVFTNYGLAPILLWPENVTFARLAPPFFGSLSLFWGAISIKKYTSKKLRLHLINNLLGWIIPIAGILIILTFLYSYITNILNGLLCLALLFIIAYLCIRSIIYGPKLERPVWVATAFGLFGIGLFLLMIFGFLQLNLWTFTIGPICFLLAGVFIMMSMGYRVTMLRRKYSQVFESVNESIILYSIEEKIITDINRRACGLFDCTVAEALKLDLSDLLKQGQSELPEIIEQFLKGKDNDGPMTTETPYITRNQVVFWGETSLLKTVINGQKSLLIVIRDITGRKKAIENLIKSEEQIRLITDALPCLIAFVNTQQKYQFVNKAYEERFGISKEAIQGKYIWEVIGQKAYGSIKQYVEEVLSGKIVEYEKLIHYESRENRWVAASYIPQYDKNNRIRGFVALVSDITETKKTEKSYRLTQHMIDHAGDAAGWIVDGKIKYVNQKACELLGYSKQELLSMYVYDVVPELANDDKGEKIGKIIKNQGAFNFEMEIKTKTDQPIQVEISATHLIYDHTEYSLFFIRDITRRKQAQNALIHHEKRLDLALSAAQLAIWDWIISPGELFFNEGWAQMLGYETIETPIDLETVLAAVHYNDKPGIRNLINRFATGEQTEVVVESRIQTKSGKYIWVQVDAKVVDSDVNGVPLRVIGIGKDISESKQVEQALIDYQNQLKSLTTQLVHAEHQERKRIATYLHDGVCQFLSSANMQLSLFRDQETSKEKIENITRILETIKSAYKVSRTLTFDLHPPVLNELGIEAAIEEFIKEFSVQTGLKCSFKHSGPERDLKRNLRGFIYRMIQELLTNVNKHAQANSCKILFIRKSNKILVSIEDDGQGFTLDDAVTTQSENRGFGLFSIQEQLLQIGGWIEISSPEGKGAVVMLYIPVYPDDLAS